MLSDNFPDSLGKTYKLAHIMFKPSLLTEVHNLTKLHSKIPSDHKWTFCLISLSTSIEDCLRLFNYYHFCNSIQDKTWGFE